jgi:ATP-dependent DNA helicase RecG
MIASVDQPTPTVVGLLTVGKSPRTWLANAYVQFLRIDGNEITCPIIDEEEIDGPIDQMLRRIDDKLKSHNRQQVVFDDGAVTEHRRSDYALVALQQLVRNAVMHRTYEQTNSPIKLYWFNDFIEIHSPGGPFGQVTVSNFGRPGYNDYRNPKVAEVLKTLGFVQRFGAGIALARKALAENGNDEPEFVVETTIVMVKVQRAK